MRTRKIISLTDHLPKSPTGAEEALRSAKVAEVREWIVAGVLAGHKKIYGEIAEQHQEIFALQERAFMGVAEALDARLRVIELALGLESPALTSLQDILDRIIPKQEPVETEPADDAEPEPTPRDVQ